MRCFHQFFSVWAVEKKTNFLLVKYRLFFLNLPFEKEIIIKILLKKSEFVIGETIWWIRYKYHIIIMACSPHFFTKKEYQAFTNLSSNQFVFEEKIIKTDKQTRLLKLVLIAQKKIVKTCIEQLINLNNKDAVK